MAAIQIFGTPEEAGPSSCAKDSDHVQSARASRGEVSGSAGERGSAASTGPMASGTGAAKHSRRRIGRSGRIEAQGEVILDLATENAEMTLQAAGEAEGVCERRDRHAMALLQRRRITLKKRRRMPGSSKPRCEIGPQCVGQLAHLHRRDRPLRRSTIPHGHWKTTTHPRSTCESTGSQRHGDGRSHGSAPMSSRCYRCPRGDRGHRRDAAYPSRYSPDFEPNRAGQRSKMPRRCAAPHATRVTIPETSRTPSASL